MFVHTVYDCFPEQFIIITITIIIFKFLFVEVENNASLFLMEFMEFIFVNDTC